MKFKNLLALLLAALLTAGLLTGCGAASNDGASNAVMDVGGAPEKEEAGLSQSTTTSGTATVQNQKLVRKLWLDAETEDLDALLTYVDERITAFSGYVQAREIYNGSNYTSRRYRSASLTIRIPADKLNEFTAQVREEANITSSNETADDITLSYVATESRITALETEQQRLLELLEQAQTMDDLLQIESRLTEVRTELEEVTSQLRLYANMVDYGTIYLNIEEVVEYTVVEEPDTVWERMGSGFMESLDTLWDGMVEVFVFIVVGIPYWIVIAAVIAIVVLIVRANRRKKRKQSPGESESAS